MRPANAFRKPLSFSPLFTLGLLLWLLTLPPVVAAEPTIEVSREGYLYQLHVEVDIPVPRARIHAALTDYPRLNKITPVITKSQLVEPGVVEMTMHGCFLIFCFDKVQTQRLHVTDYSVLGTIIPERSDYKNGWSLWLLTDTPTGTRVVLNSQFTPDFWVPPLIGSLLIQGAMERQVKRSIEAMMNLQANGS